MKFKEDYEKKKYPELLAKKNEELYEDYDDLPILQSLIPKIETIGNPEYLLSVANNGL